MAARSTTSTEWMIHPSLVFKSLEDSMIKPPFSSFNTPHIVPEKILESFVDQNGLRCYRVKWLDSWLTEQHINATFPHLITEYWINRPINDVDYHNVAAVQQQQQQQQTPCNTSTVLSQPQPGAFTISSVTSALPLGLSSAKQSSAAAQATITTPVVVDENTPTTTALHHITSTSLSSAMPVPQLFTTNNTGAIENPVSSIETPAANTALNNETSNTVLQKSQEDFVVESLKLPEQVEMKDGQKTPKENLAKQGSWSNIPKPLVPLLPKPSDNNSVQFLLGSKGAMYNFNALENKDKGKTTLPTNFQKMSPISVFSNTFNQIQFSNQQGITLPTMEQVQQQYQVVQAAQALQSNMQQQQTPEKKVVVTPKKVSTAAKTKTDTPASKTKGKQPVPCDICGKMISSRKNLRVHKTVRHFKNGSFGCHICGRKFALNRDLQRHMPLHTNERKFICQYCGLQCKQPGHLTKHLRTHTEVMNWRCDCCFKNFRVQADLKEHCFKEHADIKDKNLKCSVCQEKLKLPNSVYLHSLRHSGVREFSCEVCKATFKLKQHMQVHMKTHEKPKESEKIVCPICEKVFKAKHMFEKHVKKHTESTAEQYKENRRLEAEERKQKRKTALSNKRKLKTSSTSGSDEEEDGEDEAESQKVSGKRKQRKPNKVLYDEDLNTKLVVRRKFTDKEQHSCPNCKDTFRSKMLLKSHMKLHAQELERTKSPNSSEQFTESDGTEQLTKEKSTVNLPPNTSSTQEILNTDTAALNNEGNNQLNTEITVNGSATNNSSTTLVAASSDTNDLSFIADACENRNKDILQLPGNATTTSSATVEGTSSSSESDALNKAALILQGDTNTVG